MLEILSDKQLVDSYKNGNVASFNLLLERHQNKVFSYILMLVKDRQLADDLFQAKHCPAENPSRRHWRLHWACRM